MIRTARTGGRLRWSAGAGNGRSAPSQCVGSSGCAGGRPSGGCRKGQGRVDVEVWQVQVRLGSNAGSALATMELVRDGSVAAGGCGSSADAA